MLRMSRRMCSWALHGARELSLQGAAQRLGLTHTPLLPPLLPPAATATPWWSRGFAGSAVSPQRLPSAAYPQRAPPLYRAAVPQLPAAAAEVRRGYAIRMKAKKHTKGGKMKLPSSFKERFKVTGTGLVLRMRVGKRHCASAKSQPQRTRLRQKAVVHESRAYVMRKLGFSFAGSSRG